MPCVMGVETLRSTTGGDQSNPRPVLRAWKPSLKGRAVYYADGKPQYPVRVDNPSPRFARMLHQTIGGVEGEIRVMLQYMFQAFGNRGPTKYRDMLIATGTEEIAHVEMLATAVALNLEGAAPSLKEEFARQDPAVAAVLGGINAKNYLSAGLAAMPVDSDGVPFDCSHVYASGNIAGDMYANVTAEATGRTLATRLHSMTDDPGMKDMLAFLIARDTMHQQQWLAVIEELGGYPGVLPIPNSFPQDQEVREFSYVFVNPLIGDMPAPEGRWTSGQSLDGRGEFTIAEAEPQGAVPRLGPPAPETYPEVQQIEGMAPDAGTPAAGQTTPTG
jgi:Mn-containing catalase